MKKWKKL